jgi:hypothetical protein
MAQCLSYFSYCSTLSVGCYLYTNPKRTATVGAGWVFDGTTNWVVNSSGMITGTAPCGIPPPTDFYLTGVHVSPTGQFQMILGYSSTQGAIVYVSNDYGSTYVPQSVTGETYVLMDGAINSSGNAYVVLAQNVAYTSTNGINWTRRDSSIQFNGYVNLAMTSNTVFASAFSREIFRSLDGGINWNASMGGDARNWGFVAALNNYVIAGVNDGTVTSKVYISHNTGTSINYIFSFPTPNSAGYVGIAGGGVYMYVIAEGASGTFYKSTNYGASFTTTILNSSSQKFTTACNSKNSGVLILFRLQINTNKTIIMRSVDYGTSFAYIFNSPFTDKIVVRASMSDNGTYVLAYVQVNAGQGLYEAWLSSDGGLNWTNVSGGNNPPTYLAYGTFVDDLCVGCDLYAIRADGNGGTYQAEVLQYNTEACCTIGPGGGGGDGGGEIFQ